jgi:F-type H+-transporting ATPase subunit epsilon
MAKAIRCNIVSAENEIYSGEAELLIAATTEGDVGIGYGHSQLLATLKPGPVRVLKTGGDEEIYYVSGGFLEVQPSVVTILADTALRADDMDEAAALEAQKTAQQAMHNQSGELDYSRAAVQLAEAAAQLRTLQAIRKKLGK